MRRRAGMTLIEIMVAMTLFAGIGALIYGGFAQTARAKQRIEAQMDRYHAISIALERMVRELSAAFVSVHVNPLASLASARTAFIGKGGGFSSRIDFTSFSHTRIFRDAHESDQNELSYFLAEHPSGEGKVLARRMQPRIDDDPQEGGRVEIMLQDVLEFELSYLDPTSGEWIESWDTTNSALQANRLPAQVKILLTVPGIIRSKEREVFGTRAVLNLNWALNHAAYNE
jgi:general secretion pathway protein J